jgi:hypothetical protein
MSNQVIPISQRLAITDGIKVIEKAIFGPLTNRLTLGRKVSWDPSKYELQDAKLVVVADQDVTSGASLSIVMNEKVLSPVMRWHALETHEQKLTYRVTSEMLRGENTVVFSYEVSALHQQQATMSFQAFLDLLFEPIGKPGPDDSPVDPGTEKDKDYWNRVFSKLEANAKTIVVIGILGGLAIGIGYLYYKTSWLGRVSKIFRR